MEWAKNHKAKLKLERLELERLIRTNNPKSESGEKEKKNEKTNIKQTERILREEEKKDLNERTEKEESTRIRWKTTKRDDGA